MSHPVRLLLKDLAMRGGWILAALSALQFLLALNVFKWEAPVEPFVAPIILLSLFPFAAPSRRLLLTLPLSRHEVDRVQWLYGGGLVVLGTTAITALAWLVAIAQSAEPPLWKVALLLAGMPGAIGISMSLRRWTMGAAHPNNQARHVALPLVTGAMLIMIAHGLLRNSMTTALPIVLVLGCGWIALLVFYISPLSYYRWLELTYVALLKPVRRHGYWAARPWAGTILRGLILGVVLGGLLSWYSAYKGRTGFSVTGAVLAAWIPYWYLQSIKLLRTLPWSLNHCAAFVTATYLVPIAATVATLTAGCAIRACSPLDRALVALPNIAAIAPLVAGAVHFGLVGTITNLAGTPIRRGVIVIYMGSVIGLALVEKFIVPLVLAHPIVSNLLAASIIGMLFISIRYTIATHTLESRSQFSVLLPTS